MVKDWRWKAAILIYLAIPAFGFLQCVKQYQILDNVQHVDISELPKRIAPDLQQFQMSGFEIYGESEHKSKIVCVGKTETPDETPVVVVLECKTAPDPEKAITNITASGTAKGLASTSQNISKKLAAKMALQLPYSAPEKIFYVNVEKQYLSSTIIITIFFSLIGFIPLAWAYKILDEAQFKKRKATHYALGSVALQLEIAKQEIYRY